MAHQYGGDQHYGSGGRRTDEYGNPVRQTDEWGNPVGQTGTWGNPVRQTNEYGNPVHHGGTMGQYANTTAPTGTGAGGAYDTTGTGGAYGTIGTGGGVYMPPSHPSHEGPAGKEHGTLGGMLHRSGSSSSSSSEDDGYGGRRKKGMKEKIKEKLPGSHNKPQQYDQPHTTTTTTTTPAGATAGYGHGHGYAGTGEEQYGEKKGFMEKIKEKLPGHH